MPGPRRSIHAVRLPFFFGQIQVWGWQESFHGLLYLKAFHFSCKSFLVLASTVQKMSLLGRSKFVITVLAVPISASCTVKLSEGSFGRCPESVNINNIYRSPNGVRQKASVNLYARFFFHNSSAKNHPSLYIYKVILRNNFPEDTIWRTESNKVLLENAF